jgi:hypothetical protein
VWLAGWPPVSLQRLSPSYCAGRLLAALLPLSLVPRCSLPPVCSLLRVPSRRLSHCIPPTPSTHSTHPNPQPRNAGAEGVKAEEAFEKDGSKPDPTSTDNPEFQIVLRIIRDGLEKDGKK